MAEAQKSRIEIEDGFMAMIGNSEEGFGTIRY